MQTEKPKLQLIDSPDLATERIGQEIYHLARQEEKRHPQPHVVELSDRDKVVKISSGGPAEPIAAASARSTHAYTPKVGSMIDDRYRLRTRVGEGGVCQVFKGFDQLLKMTVAIKVLRPECQEDPDFVQTLLDEARMAMQLSHSQIVRLHTLQGTSSFYYLVMEYVEGQTLRECLADYEQLPLSTVAELLQATLPPLHHAHKRGILHNDIKPDNLLLTHAGSLKFLDFGLACLANQSTKEYALLGTPAYMSPERLRRQVLDLRSDIYSLGLTAYEMLTGQLPFPDNLSIEDYMHLGDLSLEGLPDSITRVLERAVASERRERWETVDEFTEAFLACLDDQ